MNKAIIELTSQTEIDILTFLKENLKSKSKNNIKNIIMNNCAYINGKLCNKPNYIIKANDKISIILKQIRTKNYTIDIIYEDDYFISINKPNGLLSVSTEKKSETAYSIVRNYIKETSKNSKLFILHRLDRDTSGILLFCKKESIKEQMQEDWNNIVLKRGYLAIVKKIKETKGTIKSYLYEDRNYNVKSTKDPKKGKLAITNYEVIKSNKKYSLLQIFLETGRKNQIRVHMNEIGTSILGDKKYGNLKSDRLYLHSHIFSFIHPITKEIVTIKSNCNDFNKI